MVEVIRKELLGHSKEFGYHCPCSEWVINDDLAGKWLDSHGGIDILSSSLLLLCENKWEGSKRTRDPNQEVGRNKVGSKESTNART